jgi:hypothetical protein
MAFGCLYRRMGLARWVQKALLSLARGERKNSAFLGGLARSMQRACGESGPARAGADAREVSGLPLVYAPSPPYPFVTLTAAAAFSFMLLSVLGSLFYWSSIASSNLSLLLLSLFCSGRSFIGN